MKNNLFDNIDANKSYILGFLWADGYINNRIETTIKSSDFNNIYNIFSKSGDWKQLHRDRHSKQTGKIYKSSSLYYYGKETYNFLYENDYKIKSSTQPTKILNIIPKEYHKDFYRGYIDGDGSFSYYV
jgi:intein/homing endonuclease